MKIHEEDKIQVSIITTVFNAKDFLNKSIESIRNQTFRNYEHLIINDGSTDGTKEYLDTIEDSRIKIIHLERSGRGVSLNRGLHESKGKYIAILDADDYSSNSRLELQTEILNENKDCDLIATSFGIHGIDLLPEESTHLASYKEQLKILEPKEFIFNVSMNGGNRAIVPIPSYQEVMPLNILITQLLKSLVTFDIELGEKLGVLELAPEDLGLLSYICPSKYDYQSILDTNLEQMFEEFK